jgi:hypothetical protein
MAVDYSDEVRREAPAFFEHMPCVLVRLVVSQMRVKWERIGNWDDDRFGRARSMYPEAPDPAGT